MAIDYGRHGLWEARKEVLGGKAKIETDTAIKWAGRAVAAWSIYEEDGNLEFRDMATEFASEAIEHAASSGRDEVLRDVRSALAQASRTLVR